MFRTLEVRIRQIHAKVLSLIEILFAEQRNETFDTCNRNTPLHFPTTSSALLHEIENSFPLLLCLQLLGVGTLALNGKQDR